MRPPTRSSFERFAGGKPVSVLVKLVLLSLLVGFVMVMFGFDAADLVRGALDLVRETIRDGAGLFRQVSVYILTGAAVVVPIWLVLRLLRPR
ncbi:DUF6460 domain-containing protein [Devosia sediminis]|uniref:Integrase n=1 Tax=Devosia sediminis TaxID=2798801 RepID=A0A934IXM5_9HYPH|nr:DUF6460 domain-containing protein [Devosia sediminis]MBJ3784618.1 integrase [Devosia sediminis]